jgi:hypothetical protein
MKRQYWRQLKLGFALADKLSVIDLKVKPPTVIATLESGLGAAGVSINNAGTLALVANRSEGTYSRSRVTS